MTQLNKPSMSWWAIYKKHVWNVILSHEADTREHVSYWRNSVFYKILIYLTPLSIIALIPSVFMAFMSGLWVVGFVDLLAFIMVVLIAVVPGIKLYIRKAIFIFILYFLSVILLYYLPVPGPGLMFLLAIIIFSSLIYSTSAAYFSSWANTFICVCFLVLIYFGIGSTISSEYHLGSWIAVSSNLILLSFACAKCLDLLLEGLKTSLKATKMSDTKLEKTNRLYQFISQINHTIVYVKDAETLFRDACSIALKFGNYQMAWIGSFDHAHHKMTLLGSSGILEEDIKLFTDIPYGANSPQDYVLTTGSYFLCNDIDHTLNIKSWKAYAKDRQIGSFIVLPIKKAGRIIGTFNLYGTGLHYFREDDIALLIGVTNDISFALDLFEKAERHTAAEKELQKNFMELEAISKEQSTLLNTLPASIALLDHKGHIVKVNNEWIQFGKVNGQHDYYPYYGKNYIEISEKSLDKEAKDGLQMAQGLRDILSGNKAYFSMEYACDSPNEKRWFKAEVRPFKSHVLTGAVVMHINISERKKAENEMLLLINNTEEAFILLNNSLKIVSFNKQFEFLYATYFGLKIQKGVSILDYAQANRKDMVAAIYQRVLGGHVEESEIEIPDLKNTIAYFSIKYSPARDESGNIFGVFVTAIDITEKKKATDQKEFERRDKEALINSTDDLIWSLSKDFKLIAANNAFINELKHYSGISIKSGDDLLTNAIYPSDYLQYWKDLYNRAHTGEAFKIEIYTPSTSGRNETWSETSFSPIIVNEQIAGVACYSRNITERKKAEDTLILTSNALQYAVNDLNKIMDSSLDVICVVDAEGRFLKVSAACETVWGYTPAELIGKPIFSLVYHEDVEKTKLSAKNVMAGNHLNHFENRYVHKDGSLVSIEWTARWDAKDQIRYGVARDVSEKKRLKSAVENERRRFYDLFSEAPSSMGFLSGPNHVFEIVNPLYLQLIGKNDIVGKSLKEVLPEAVDQGFFELLDEVYRTGKTFSTNEMLIKLDIHGNGQLVDKYLNFTYRAHRTESREIDGILFFAVDVTEQVVLRKKIEESEAKLKEAQALSRISNWEVDLVTNVTSWSDEFYNILGYGKDDIVPSLEAFLSLLHPDDFDLASKKIEKTSQTFEADSFSVRMKMKSGKIIYVYSEWKFEFDINSNPIRLYGILQDVSERKMAEEEREKLIDDLFQRNRDLEQFSFIISHNLRAPTANIIGFTEHLQDGTLTLEEQKEFLQGLASSVSGLDNVIKDLNSILQVKHEINEKKETVYFSNLVNDIVVSIGSMIDIHQVAIVTDFKEVDEFFSLRVYMHSIFYNLISNSIKYRKPDELPLVEIKSKLENGKTILIFKDNGLGIDMHTKGDKIFGLYKRFHSHVEGKGMGLFMVKTQVEALGGKITVESELLKGTEFTIVFESYNKLL